LMDLHLPGSDAAEITRWLKQLRKPPVVFVVTSDDSPPARRRCLAAGADAFLVKSGELAVQLRKAVQKYFSDDFPEPKISTAIS
ncbi:MAG TPA: response regulator, partial [Candidatus Polarisedimenticolia bacterium]|nr:response regulator [Candidatus Polarisedimenticolia bacterium]